MSKQTAHQHTQNLRKNGTDTTSTHSKLVISQITCPKNKHLTHSFQAYTLERQDITNEKTFIFDSGFKVPHFPLSSLKYKIKKMLQKDTNKEK